VTLELQPHAEGVVLRVRVQPGAKKSRMIGPYAGGLKIAIAAPPVDGKANSALIEFLSESLGIRRSQIEILRGETSKEKFILIRGVNQLSAADFADPRG